MSKQLIFGSFQSPSLAVLAQQPLFSAPKLKEIPALFDKNTKKLFCVGESHVFLNHGAFGASSRRILRHTHRFRRLAERQPLSFFDRRCFGAILKSIRLLARHLGMPASRLLPTMHCTSALNAALAAVRPGGTLLILRPGYGSTRKIAAARGLKMVEWHVPFLARREGDPMDLLRAALPDVAEVDAVLVEHIGSQDAFEWPVEEIYELTSKRFPGSLFIVDGAHTPGTRSRLPLPDAPDVLFAGNLHKWFMSARGCGFLRLPPNDVAVRAPITSHGAEDGPLADFIWDGNRDYSPWLSLPAAIQWWDAVGGEEHVTEQAANLADRVEEAFCSSFGTKPLPQSSRRVPMRLIAMPRPFEQQWFFERGIEVPVKVLDGQHFWRLSFAMYNTFEDYEALRKLVVDKSR